MNDGGTYGWFVLCILLILLILFAYIVVFKRNRNKHDIQETKLKEAMLSGTVNDNYI